MMVKGTGDVRSVEKICFSRASMVQYKEQGVWRQTHLRLIPAPFFLLAV